VAGLGLLGGVGWGRPVDLSAPTGGIGSAGLYGDLQLWREVEGVGLQLGPGSYLPLRFRFSSSDNSRGLLGPGFYLPMFEAKNVLIREQMMRAYLPCGKGLYLRRDTVDLNKFQTLDGEWTGLVTNNGDDFILKREDGWKLLYHKGRLTSLVTDDNHTFSWDLDRSGLPSGVSEDGHPLITLEPNAAGQIAALIFDGKRYEIGYAERPLTEVLLGQTAVKELVQTLATFKYPDGTADTFKFELTPDRVPILTYTDKDKAQTLYSWDAATSHLATEKGPQGDWTYTVGKITQDYGVPTITRTNNTGKTESMAINTKIGAYTQQLADGTTLVTHLFETPGPLYNKVKSVEKISILDGKEVITTTFKASYDEAGRIIREVDEKGFISTFAYGQDGKPNRTLVSPPSDPQILDELKIQEKSFLADINKTSGVALRDDKFQTLGLFYIYKMGDPKKALALIPQMTGHIQIFNIKLHSIVDNKNLPLAAQAEQLQALIKDYPEQKEMLSQLIDIKTKEKNENM